MEADKLFEILLYLPSILKAIEHAKNLIKISTVVIRSLRVEEREKSENIMTVLTVLLDILLVLEFSGFVWFLGIFISKFFDFLGP